MATWDAWGNQYWPAKYLIDQRGHVRYVHFGEGDYEETEEAIRVAARASRARWRGPARTRDRGRAGDARDLPRRGAGGGLHHAARRSGRSAYTLTATSARASSASAATWTVDDESATAGRDAVLRARVLGKDVYLVLSGPGTVRVTVDGRLEKTVRVTRRASTRCCRGPRPASTSSSCASRPASRATRSRSADPKAVERPGRRPEPPPDTVTAWWWTA